jgi:hypothetical protein
LRFQYLGASGEAFFRAEIGDGVLNLSKNVVSPMCGKYEALATPMRALADSSE